MRGPSNVCSIRSASPTSRPPRGFDHLAQTTVIDAHGRIYRQVYGDAFAVPALVEPLKDLALGSRPRGPSSATGWTA